MYLKHVHYTETLIVRILMLYLSTYLFMQLL